MEKESNVPFLGLLHEGVVSCPQCFSEINDFKPFTITNCPGCELPLYMPLIIKDYVLYKPLGQGGEGHVYKALKRGSKEKLAIKFFYRGPKTSEEENPFVQEGTAGATVGNHPNLLNIIDFGCEKEEFFIVYALLEGERLDEYIKRKKQLSETRAFNIMVQIISAEKHICKKKYLYRDLKPENILLEKSGNLKLFDYGLCIPIKNAQVQHEELGDEFIGSPHYIPPERVLGAPEGEYSEIYSLGMLLFHMLAGGTYLNDRAIEKLVRKHADEVNFESVKSRLNKCHPQTIMMVDKMIKKNPTERYQTFKELKKDITSIQKVLHDKPMVLLQKNQPPKKKKKKAPILLKNKKAVAS